MFPNFRRASRCWLMISAHAPTFLWICWRWQRNGASPKIREQILWYFEILTWESRENRKMCNHWKRLIIERNRWKSGTLGTTGHIYSADMLGTFHARYCFSLVWEGGGGWIRLIVGFQPLRVISPDHPPYVGFGGVYVGVCVWLKVDLSCFGRTIYAQQFLGAKPPIQFRHRWAERNHSDHLYWLRATQSVA